MTLSQRLSLNALALLAIATSTLACGTDSGLQATGQDAAPQTSEQDRPSTTDSSFVHQTQERSLTLSSDVDITSYIYTRQSLEQGQLPAPETVRVEALVNVFNKQGPIATSDNTSPVSMTMEAAPSPFNTTEQLLKIKIQAQAQETPRDPVHLAFLVDVSSSMQSEHKLGLLEYTLQTLLHTLQPEDRLSLVTYAGRSEVLLPSHTIDHRGQILEALVRLRQPQEQPTNPYNTSGLEIAAAMARQDLPEEGQSHLILCTDGDFAFDMSPERLKETLGGQAPVALHVWGMGTGTGINALPPTLDNQEGHTLHNIQTRSDTLLAMSTTFLPQAQPLGKDLKVQLTFNPKQVQSHRLIGYSSTPQTTDDQTTPPHDLTPGQTLVAYLALDLGPDANDEDDHLVDVTLRYKTPLEDRRIETMASLTRQNLTQDFAQASAPFRFGAAVAIFGETLQQQTPNAYPNLMKAEQLALDALENPSQDAMDLLEMMGQARELWRR